MKRNLKFIWIISLVGLSFLAIVLAGCAAGAFTAKAKPTYVVSGYVKDANGNGISGVVISFSGVATSVTTDSNGHWTKSGLKGKATVSPSKAEYTFEPLSTTVSSSRADVAFKGVSNKITVTFPDPNLEAVIRKAINKPTGPIYGGDLLAITSLEHGWPNDSEKISNLEGIQYCVNLQNLSLAENQISDITPLQNLTNLRVLNLCTNNRVSNIAPLQNLTNLRELFLSHNQISDITPIRGLTSIRTLLIGGNPILKSNWAFLKNWTWLGIFGLDKMNLNDSDITFLSKFTNLCELYLNNNQISDITPLQNLTYLRVLGLDENRISDITPLQNLTNLGEIQLYGNQIADIQPLVDNPGIGSEDYINIQYNHLDLSPNSTDMKNIKTLIDRGVKVEYKP